jgi:RimJ/RimL family protein N-acetyltransferase
LSAIVLDAIFRYPFVTVGCQLVLMRVSARNKRLTKQLDRLALRRHEIPRLYGRNEDGVIYSMADNDWANWPFKRKS